MDHYCTECSKRLKGQHQMDARLCSKCQSMVLDIGKKREG